MAPLIGLVLKALLPSVVRKIAEVVTTPKKETEMDVILGLVRHVLTAGGGILVAKGYIDAGMVEGIVGAVLTLGGAIWSVYDKKAGPKIAPDA